MPDVDAKAGDGVSAENAEEAGQRGSSSSSIDIDQLQNKRFKAADLPLTAAQRQSIDGLLYCFKKGGDFDAVRKKIWADFAEGDALEEFKQLLFEKAESEIDREPSLLSRERGKAATLIEGAVDRSDLYKNIEDILNKYTSSHLDSILEVLRTLRRRDVSEEQARAEEESGRKPDEEYKEIVEARRREREIAHLKELEIQKQKEIEEAKRQAEEADKKREAKRRQAEEERRIREERDERRRAERDKMREDHMTLDELRDKERYDRRRRDDQPYLRDSRDRPLGDRWEPSMDRNRSPNPPAPIDEKSLEDAALELLLKEGKELAERSRHRPEFNFEKADPLDASTSHASPSSRPKPGSSSKVPPDDPDSKRARYDRGREPRSYTSNVRPPYAPRIRDERGRVDREYSRADDRGRDRSSAGGNDGYRPSYRRDSHPRWESSRSRSPDRSQDSRERSGEEKEE
ncbi:nucleolar complex protein 14 [Ascosphaera pollenicola]|nr:nucleolar complex protein 14 [Ascosphaera pollenicola]